MKLRRIALTNVRRFARTVELAGLGDGLNLLCAPNEAGKSTVFDALGALFFTRASSWNKTIKSLQPYAGGDPQVTVEIETPQGLFTLSKTWSNSAARKDVRVTQAGRLVAQSDAAEDWIADLVRAPKDGGPSGLLWVRQGLLALEDDENGLAARRDVLSSVAGEVEAMTGGRRMEAALAQVGKRLDDYVTSRGAKKNGPLDMAQTETAALEAKQEDLAVKADALRGALEQRRLLGRELAELEDPLARRERQDKLREAEAEATRATQHADRLSRAVAEAGRALALLDASRGHLDRLQGAIAEGQAAREAQALAAGELATAQAVLSDRADAVRAADATEQDSRTQAEAAATLLRQVERAAAGASAQALRQELAARIARGDAQAQAIATARAAAGIGPEAKTIARLEELQAALHMAERLRAAAAPTLEMHYAAGAAGAVHLAGAALPEGKAVPVIDPAELEIDGIGTLTVRPPAGAASTHVAEASAALRDAVAAAGVDSLQDARQAAQDRQAAQVGLSALARAFEAEFPEGLDPLRARLAGLAQPADISPEGLPERDAAEAGLAAAQAALAERTGAAVAARAALAEAQRRADQWAEKAEAAGQRAERADAALAGDADPAAALQAAQDRLVRERQGWEVAEAARVELARDAPDAEAAALRLDRLRQAQAQAAARMGQLRENLAELQGQIGSVADAGVDEDLAETQGQLDAARARRDAIRFEVEVLTRLQGALEDARAAARDSYVAPVTAELRPLLAQFLPGAELALDADAVLPAELTRNAQAEPIEGLSGGTREQIALLVRLAFARMLARAGRPAPVILDDALVFTDDDRIERMFDALTRQAQDIQILVFSCRQRAFRDLGGHAVTIAPASVPGPAVATDSLDAAAGTGIAS